MITIKRTKSIIQYSEILLLILISFSPLLPILFNTLFLVLIILINFKFIKFINNPLILFYLFFFIFSMYFEFFDSSGGLFHPLSLYFSLCFLVGYIYSRKFSPLSFLKKTERIIFILSVFSLLSVFIYTFFPSIVFILPKYNFYHTTRHTAFVFNFVVDGNSVIGRNSGIAWEPGVFQMLVNLGIAIHFTTNKKFNPLRIFVYAFVLFTTRSTTGLIILIILITYFSLNNLYIFFLVTFGFLLFYQIVLDEYLFQVSFKLFDSYSFNTRLDPFLNTLKIITTHPLGFGNYGYDNYISINDLLPWDSFSQIILRYGVLFSILISISLFKLFRNYLPIFVIVGLTFFSQGIWFTPFIVLFYFLPKGGKNIENSMGY